MTKSLASQIMFICAGLFCAQSSVDSSQFGLPVSPLVTGFGLDTKGGCGGEIIRVIHLGKDGSGSRLEALQTPGSRVVVFEVAGVIDLEGSTLQISNLYITLAGQTALSPGITLIKGGIKIRTHDVILQHIKVRPGEAGHRKKCGWEVDRIATTMGAYNVIVGHCSLIWATDENLSASGPIFEGKNANEILVIGNLFANNMRRNPYCKGGTQVAILNNYIILKVTDKGNPAISRYRRIIVKVLPYHPGTACSA